MNFIRRTVFRDLVHPPIFVEHLSEIVRTGEKPKEQKQKGTSNRVFLKKESEKDQELFGQQKSELAFSRRYAVTWRIEAIKDDTVVAGTSITPTPEVRLQITTDRQHMMEESATMQQLCTLRLSVRVVSICMDMRRRWY